MPEGITPYPRWEGTPTARSRLPVIAENEIRNALRNRWSLMAIALGIAWGLSSIIEFYQLRGTGTTSHDIEGFLAMLRQLAWFALAVGAAVGGPMLLEDARRGALELYLSRSVSRLEYLGGKIVALLTLTTAVIAIPAVMYWGFSFVFYENHPDAWATAIFPALLYALMWGLMASGLALGISSVSRSSGAAALLLFGAFATFSYLVDPPALLSRIAPLTALTEDARFAILNPFAALEGQFGWLFSTESPHAFPFWWGLLVWGALTGLGWGLLAWRHPRQRGEDRG